MKLPEFFRILDGHADHVPIDDLVALMQRLEITRGDVEEVVRFDDGHYKRNILKVGSGYAALILCWQPGQASPIHDHRGSACGVLVLEGVVTETKYGRAADGMLFETDTRSYRPGSVCGSWDADIHVIRNDEPAGRDLITLHVYTPPLRSFHLYRLDSPEVETRTDEETAEAQRQVAAQPR
jgi:cysteine dioxygenase